MPPWGYPPPRAKYWQGRNEELQKIDQWLTDETVNLIGIEGVGGFGKSSLAAKIYAESTGFVNRFWADVSRGLNFTELARQALMQFRDLSPQEIELTYPEIALTNALLNCLRDQRYLLVIDNLETLLHSETRQLHDPFYEEFFCRWLQCGGKSVVLVTTQEHPDLAEVKPHWLKLGGLQPVEGAQLLQSLGIQGEEAELTEFSAVVDGCPLTLNLVAGLLNAEEGENPPLSRLSGYGEPLQVRGLHRGEKLSTEAVLDASFNRVSYQFQALLLNVSVYRRPFNVDAVTKLMPGVNISEQDLKSLVKRSLLRDKVDKQGVRWFYFQPLVLAYAKQKVGDQTTAHWRAFDYYCSVIESLSSRTIESLVEYLEEIFYHACEVKEHDLTFYLLNVFDRFLDWHGYNNIRIKLCQQLIDVWKPSEEEQEKFVCILNCLGEAYNSIGQPDQGLKYLEKALALVKKFDDQHIETKVLHFLGNSYRALGKYKQAINCYENCLFIIQEGKQKEVEAICLGGLANVYLATKNHQKAIDYSKKALALAEFTDPRNKAIFLANLGSIYFDIKEYQQAINYYLQALDIQKRLDDQPGMASVLLNLVAIYTNFGKPEEAIIFSEQCLKLVEKFKNYSIKASCLYNLGCTYQVLGDYLKSIKCFQESLNIKDEFFSKRGDIQLLEKLGFSYLASGDYELALSHYKKALEACFEIGNQDHIIISIMMQIGMTYKYTKQYKNALYYFNKSLKLLQNKNQQEEKLKLLASIGAVYNYLKNYPTAIIYFKQGLNIAQETNDYQGIANLLNELGNIYRLLGFYKTSIYCCRLAIENSIKIHDYQIEAHASYNLGMALYSIGKRKDAIASYQNAFRIYYEIKLYQDADDAREKIQYLNRKRIILLMFLIDKLNCVYIHIQKLWKNKKDLNN